MIDALPIKQRNIALGLVGLVAAFFIWRLRAVLNPLLLGYVLAFILRPLVKKLKERGMGHTFAVSTIFVGATGLALSITLLLASESSHLVQEMLEAQPAEPVATTEAKISVATADPSADDTLVIQEQGGLWYRIRSQAGELMGDDFSEHVPTKEELLQAAGAWLMRSEEAKGVAGDVGIQAGQIVWERFRGLLTLIFGVANLALLVPIYAFFLLFEIEQIHGWLRGHLPAKHKEQLLDVVGRIGEIVSSFLRGRLVIALIKGVLLTLALWILRVPYPFLVGFSGGLLSLLPFIGGVIGFGLGIAAASLNHNLLAAFLISGAVFGAAELIEGYVLLPRIVGESLGLSEVAVLFSITAGGTLMGLFGVLVALPGAATIKVLFNEFVDPALLDFLESEPAPDDGT